MFLVRSILLFQRTAIDESSAEKSVNIAVMALETALPLAIIIAALCSVFLYIRAKSVNLLQVHERLHNLEEMVKVLLSKQSFRCVETTSLKRRIQTFAGLPND